MEIVDKQVCLICSSGNIILSFDTALSLIFEALKTHVLYCVNDNGLKNNINLINKFIELGNNEKNSIVLEYAEDIDNDENNELYFLIIGGLEDRISFLHQHIFE